MPINIFLLIYSLINSLMLFFFFKIVPSIFLFTLDSIYMRTIIWEFNVNIEKICHFDEKYFGYIVMGK